MIYIRRVVVRHLEYILFKYDAFVNSQTDLTY